MSLLAEVLRLLVESLENDHRPYSLFLADTSENPFSFYHYLVSFPRFPLTYRAVSMSVSLPQTSPEINF